MPFKINTPARDSDLISVLDGAAAAATSISIPQRHGATTYGRCAEEEVG
jgi:hypothetical protein